MFTPYLAEIIHITLHCSYLVWPKYKTAKPLLYTVYRTRNRKRYLSVNSPELIFGLWLGLAMLLVVSVRS